MVIAQYIAKTRGLNAALNFLKAGLGFFNSGLMEGHAESHPMLAIIRLQAIKEVLQNTKNSSIPNILSLVLPYSNEDSNVTGRIKDPDLAKKVQKLLNEIREVIEDKSKLNKHWGGSANESYTAPPKVLH